MSSVATTDEPERAFAGPERDDGGYSLGELVEVLRRRARLIALVAAAVILSALVYALVATRLYTASAVVLLEPRSSLSQSDGMRYSFASDSALVDSQMKLLTSETVLRRAVDRENLQEDAEFGQPSGGIWWSLRRLLGLAGSGVEERRDSVNATVIALEKAVTVKRPERTYVMEVSVSSVDARKAARLANAIAEAYIADQTDARGEISRREQEFLENNIAELRRKIETAEKAVEDYKAKNQIIGASGKLVNEQLLSEVNTELASAQARAAEARSRFDQVRKILAAGRSVETLPEALKSPVIDKLRIQYAEIVRQEANAKSTLGERHPQYREIQQQLRDTRRLITEELNRIVEAARNDMRVAESNETSIARQVEQLKREATTTNQSSVPLRELEREVDTNKAVLDNLLKAKGNVTRDSVDMPIARIIARAAPPLAPSSPRRIPIMLLATAIGLGLGAVAAFAAEGLAAPGRGRVAPPAPAWSVLRFPPANDDGQAIATEISDTPYAAALQRLTEAAPRRAGPDHPGACLVIDCATGGNGARLAADLARACFADGRSTLLMELSDRPGRLSRDLNPDLPVGVVEMNPGAFTPAVLAADEDHRRLVVAPFIYGRREAPGGDQGADAGFGRAGEFDLLIGYAPDAPSLRSPEDAAAGAGLVALAVDSGTRLSAAERGSIERIVAAAKGRCLVVSAPAAAA